MNKLALMQGIENLTFSIEMATEEIKKYLKNVDRPTTHYIWRTKGDGKVRSRHAKFDGKIFAWDNPPEGGYHPGEDYGCRCIAEPYEPETEKLQERVSQTVTSSVSDKFPAWTTDDFIGYYFFGGGNTILLSDIGFLQKTIDHVRKIIFPKVESQIIEEARRNGEGSFPWDFNRSYNFRPVIYEFGDSVVEGIANKGVKVIEQGQYLIITADIEYIYSDTFTDVFNIDKILNWLKEQSKPTVGKFIRHMPLGYTRTYIELIYSGKPLPRGINKPEIGQYDLPLSTPYRVIDTWTTHIEAIVKK